MRYTGTNIEINVNHHTVSYNDEGPDDAPVIIFIHGFPFNKSMWDLQVEALKDDYRVIAYDIRGHGNSGKNGDFSMDMFINDLIDLMDKLETGKAILCGMSMGGYIALHAFIKYPHSFDLLVLSSTKCSSDTTEEGEKRMRTIDNIGKEGVEKYAEESIKELFSPESFTSKQEEIASVKTMIMETPEYSLCNTLRALTERKDICSKLAGIDKPVLIMVGQQDNITPVATARLINEKIEDSVLHIIEHAGHMANMENPQEFNKQLKTSISQLTKKKTHSSAWVSN